MIKSGLSIVLSLFVLAGSIHLPVYKHTCHLFDKSEIAILLKKDCCYPGESTREQSVDFKCCSLDELDTSITVETTLDVKTEFYFSALPIEINDYKTVSKTNTIDEDLPVLRPPPLANREIHNLYQTYRI